MISDIHALISSFPQLASVVSMVPDGSVESSRFAKSGVIPFLRQKPRIYYFMKPSGKIPGLDLPSFQICKGTRMEMIPGIGWRDMREVRERGYERETLLQTALREGIEEVGLKPENIVRVLEMGPYGFSSATTGKSKEMWLFAAEMQSMDNFLHDREIATSTGDRKWLSEEEFTVVGREDHRYILKDIADKISLYYKE